MASVPSFWLSRDDHPEEIETLVIGAGVVGLSTAYWLTRKGHLPVVVDADGIATHASGRNAGFLLTGTAETYVSLARSIGEAASRRLWEMSTENRNLLRGEILGPQKVDCEFVPEGSWIVGMADRPEQEKELRESFEKLTDFGLDLHWREAAEVRQASGCDGFAGGIHQPQDGGIDASRLCRGLARLVRAAGGEVRTGVRVRRLEPRGGRVLVVTDQGHFLCERVILALNAYAPSLLPHLQGEIRPVRGQVFTTAPGSRDLQGVWYVNEGYEYFRQLPDGTFLLGGCRWVSRETEVGYEETPTAKVQGALDEFLRSHFPRFADRPVLHRWAGTMAFTEDGLPRTGEVPGVPGAYYAAGMNGHGMSLGFFTGRWLAETTLGEGRGELFPPAVRPASA